MPAGADVELFYSSAIAPENAERAAARERGLAERPRAELLAELTALRRTIAVAGTHGKTTTAAMLVHALRAAGMAPGWLIGGALGGGLANAEWGEGEWLVVEADESDRSMLSLAVEIAVLTNVELDHHATYGSLAELRGAFREFLARPRQAVVWDRAELLELRGGAGPGADADAASATAASGDLRAKRGGGELIAYDAREVELLDGGSRFEWRGHTVTLAVPGAHNALNATGALEAARLAGAEEAAAVAGLAAFGGAGRRFQALGESARGARVFDDYAHHPTEVAATLAAARTLRHDRLVAVFQPHLYSRTASLAAGFGRALAAADVTVVLDVYAARERAEDHPGVSGLLVAEATAREAGGRPVYWLARRRGRARGARRAARRGRCVRGDGGGRRRRAGARAGGGVSATKPPPGVRRDFPLARLTTVRTGGAGEYLRARGQRRGARRAARVGGRRGARAQRGGLGLEPADRR